MQEAEGATQYSAHFEYKTLSECSGNETHMKETLNEARNFFSHYGMCYWENVNHHPQLRLPSMLIFPLVHSKPKSSPTSAMEGQKPGVRHKSMKQNITNLERLSGRGHQHPQVSASFPPWDQAHWCVFYLLLGSPNDRIAFY